MRFYFIPLSDTVIIKQISHTLLPYDSSSPTAWLIPEKLMEAIPVLSTTRLRLSEFPSTSHSYPAPNESFSFKPDLEKMLQGRRLLLDEVTAEFSLEEIHEHVCQGFVQYSEGIIDQGSKTFCTRCGNSDSFLLGVIDCARCGNTCTYCRACIMMGRVSSCSPFLTWHGESENKLNEWPSLGWEGELSPAQQRAADALMKEVQTPPMTKSRFYLTWAVCGAGKTEMLFPAILAGLQANKAVLIATPRTDVVLELLPRLRQAFPNTLVEGFYGGAEDRYAKAELTIATTHQLLRYHNHFPLVIIDEVDAFPYSYDKKLHFAVEKASTRPSLTIYVTATPPEELKRAVELGKLPHVKVPRRYHGHPLPVPKQKWIGNWRKLLHRKKKLPSALLYWINNVLTRGKQVFLFLPRVALQPDVVSILRDTFDQVAIEWVHANDEERREKVMRFRQNEIRVLVTTTILERGVTVKGVQVGVLGAEDRIFAESTLVQIAGRAGRSVDEPNGDVIFFHYGKTKAIVDAIRHIEAMNQEQYR